MTSRPVIAPPLRLVREPVAREVQRADPESPARLAGDLEPVDAAGGPAVDEQQHRSAGIAQSPRGISQPARRPPAPAAMRNSHHGFSSRQLAAWSLIQAPSGWWLASKDTFSRHAALVTAPAWSFWCHAPHHRRVQRRHRLALLVPAARAGRHRARRRPAAKGHWCREGVGHLPGGFAWVSPGWCCPCVAGGVVSQAPIRRRASARAAVALVSSPGAPGLNRGGSEQRCQLCGRPGSGACGLALGRLARTARGIRAGGP